MDEALLPTIFEALANLKAKTDDLVEELNGFEDEFSKSRDLVNKQIEDLTVQMDRLIKEAVKALPKAKDGSDGKNGLDAEVDYETLKDFILKAVDVLPKAINGKDGSSGQDGEKGRDGLDGAKGQDGSDGSDGEDGKQGSKGKDGHIGKDGEDGLSIEDLYEKNGYIVITLSDGTIKELKLPKIEKHMTRVGGGGDDNFSYDLVDKVVTIQYNQQMIVMGEIIVTSELQIVGRLIMEN